MPSDPTYPYERRITKRQQKRLDRIRKERFKRDHPLLFDHHGKRKQ
jgi:hypothetical protein